MKAIFIDGPLVGKCVNYQSDQGQVIRTFERTSIPVQPIREGDTIPEGSMTVTEVLYHRIAKTRDPNAFIYSIEERKKAL